MDNRGLNVEATRNLLLQVLQGTRSDVRRKILMETLDELQAFENTVRGRVDTIVGEVREDLEKLCEVEATMAGINAMPPVICGTVKEIEKVDIFGFAEGSTPVPLSRKINKYINRLEEVVTDIDKLIDPKGKYVDPDQTRGKVRRFVQDYSDLKLRLSVMKRDIDQAQGEALTAKEELRQIRKGGSGRG